MPRVRKGPYDKLKKSELKALLVQRDQSTTSLQSTLAVHVTNSDDVHTISQDNGLDFLGFPGEVRNEIYKLVADYTIQKHDSRACTVLYSEYAWDWKKDRRLIDCGNPQLMILQPGLFLTCSQIRTEGLPFFYQRRRFNLRLNHGKRVLDLCRDQAGFSDWFQAIGDIGQQNIRHLTLRNAPIMKSIDSIERIHRKLSDEAAVVYEAETCLFATALWKVGAKYEAKNKEKIPLFWHERNGSTRRFSDFDKLPGWGEIPGCRLGFKAGSGWFGMAQDDKAQLWWRRDKRIEKRNQEWLTKDEELRFVMRNRKRNGQPTWWGWAEAAAFLKEHRLLERDSPDDWDSQKSEDDIFDGYN